MKVEKIDFQSTVNNVIENLYLCKENTIQKIMIMNKKPSLIITLFVDFILLFLGAATIAFINVGGIFVFLIEFYFIRYIHRNIYKFLTKERLDNTQRLHENQDRYKDSSNPLSLEDPKFIKEVDTIDDFSSKAIEIEKSNKINEFITINKPLLKSIFVILSSLIGLTIIAFIFSVKTNKKTGEVLYPIYENGLYGFIDSVGNRVIEPQFLWSSPFYDGMALVVTDTIYSQIDDSLSYFTGYNERVIKKPCLLAKYGFINHNGKFVLPPNFFCYANLSNDDSDYNIELFSNVFHHFTFRSGRALVYDTLTWKAGYIDKTGAIVIPQKYYYANQFNDGLAVVYEKTGKPLYSKDIPIVRGYLRAGYIDVNGESITECKFESLTRFNSQRGIGKITENNDQLGYTFHNILLNEKGEPIDTLSMFNRYYGFNDGISVCEQVMFIDSNDINQGPSYSFINKKGNSLEPLNGMSDAYAVYMSKREDIVQVWPENVDFTNATYFEDGLAGVTPDDENWFFIDKYLIVHGNRKDPSFEKIKGFSNSLCAVKKNGKWGFVNRKIKEVIPLKYDSCGEAYPYLEEAFELNDNGKINKKLWINRFDSIVWESNETNNIINKYSDKKKSEWGRWTNNDNRTLSGFNPHYLYVTIVLIFILFFIYYILRKDYQAISFKRKYLSIPLAICSLVICLMSAHYIMNYLLGDYTQIDKEFINESTSNIKRRNSINYKCFRYENERFRSQDSIGESPSNIKWLQFGIGSLPTGKYISTYVGSGKDKIYAETKKVTRHSKRPVPNYKTINYGYGYKETYQDGWKWEEYSYTDYEPVYKDYTWYYAISSFDISDRLSLFCNEDSVYSEYLKEIENQLVSNYGYKYVYTKVKGKKALKYTTYDGVPLKRIIFCANERAYVIETRSIGKLNEHSEEACSKIILKNFDISQKDNKYMTCAIIGLLGGVILLLSLIKWQKRKGEFLNKKAHKLFRLSILSAFINLFLSFYVVYKFYIIFDISETLAYILVFSLLSCFIISIPLVNFYGSRENILSPQWIIPSWLDNSVYSNIKTDFYKKLFITFVVYPLMVISLVPCGIIILYYVIPIIIFSIFLVYVNKWAHWLSGTNNQENNIDAMFIDYYNVLNVSFNANQNDINVAYNSKMTFFNQSVNIKSLYKNEIRDLQEAYRVLSTPNMKTLYDKEYSRFSNSDSIIYKLSNPELIKFICDMRNNNKYELYQNYKINRILLIIIILFAIIILFVSFFVDN